MQQSDQNKKLHKIIVVIGPTASGKTALAITLAKIFDGEVVSADSRQVYRGLNIGTGKVAPEEMRGISHHLIDIADPSTKYTASDFLRDANSAIQDITARDKLPIIAGGTFFYIDILLGNRAVAGVPVNITLRANLERFSVEELYEKLLKLDPQYAERIDRHNRRRLERALEIVAEYGTMPALAPRQRYEALILGIDIPREILRERIGTRLDATLERGLVEETKDLLAQGIPESRLNEIGLQYRVVLAHLRGEYDYEEMHTVLKQKIWQYAKRQYTWLKRMKNVQWVSFDETQKAIELARNFCGR